MGTIFSDDAGTFPRGSSIDHPELALAQREIKDSFGDEVSILRKNKSLRKFGRSSVLQIGVWGDITANPNASENYLTDNTIDFVVSSSAADVSDDLTIEGHTIDGDGNFTFVVQTTTLTGQTPVALTTPLARASRAYNTGPTGTLGTVSVYDSSQTAVVAGVPSTAVGIYLQIPAGKQQSAKCATTISQNDYLILLGMGGHVERSGSTSADFQLEIRRKGSVFRESADFSCHSAAGSIALEFHVPIIVPANADVRMRALASANNTVASAWFEGYLAVVL